MRKPFAQWGVEGLAVLILALLLALLAGLIVNLPALDLSRLIPR